MPGWSVLLVLMLAGCGEQRAYVVSSLNLNRSGWDTLAIDVSFAEDTMMGLESATPESTTVYLFSAAYDTLYAGSDSLILVPDAQLGDSERLMVEVCGIFDRQMVCEQDAVNTSPKRIRLEHNISYPDDSRYQRGSYHLRFVVERQHFGNEMWERVERTHAINGYLLAYVGGQQEGTVKVPFERGEGRFDLQRYAGYRDFQYHLKSKLLDDREARVRFDVYAGLDKRAIQRVATVEKRVRKKTHRERAEEVRYFAEQATDKILDKLGVEGDDRHVRAYIDDWMFDDRTDTYSVEMEIEWGRGYFFGRRYHLRGLLKVDEAGASATFDLYDANSRAEQLWYRAVRHDMLKLGVLEPLLHDAPPDLSVNAGQITRRVAEAW